MNNDHKVLEFSQITDLIYLGTNLCCSTVPHIKILLDHGIKADIDLEEERQEETPNIDTYLWLPVKDHLGDIFIVSIVVTGKERDELLRLCEDIEEKSGKGKFKWGKAEHNRRIEYIAGFVRDVLDKEGEDMEKLFKEAIKNEGLIEV